MNVIGQKNPTMDIQIKFRRHFFQPGCFGGNVFV
jgi:hypothetical protein